ncbi:hypothetical protein [Pseudoduganella lurida]|nr:hypothetical protein [Pseudoduganella lurida]
MPSPHPAHRWAIPLLLAALAGSAHAQQPAASPTGVEAEEDGSTDGTSSWAVSGFGTLGAAHSTSRDADYNTSVLKRSGAGATRSWSPDVDSRLGAQLDVKLDRRWSAVIQLVSEQRLEHGYRPQVEWANVKYQATPDLALRIGRIALPMFLTADYRKVGYAYPWVRPPVEGYASLPLSSSDGVDATLHWEFGPVRNISQVFVGHDKVAVPEPLEAYGRKLLGLSNSSDWGALNVRVNMMRGEITTNIGSGLFAILDRFGPAGQALTSRYAVDHKQATLLNVGVNYDPGNWFVMGEVGHLTTHSLLGEISNAYLSAGWRWHALTPYATVSGVRPAGSTADAGLPLAGLPPVLAAQTAALNAGLRSLLQAAPHQTSTAIGVRWDAYNNVAFKLQLDRVKPLAGSRGTLINTTPAFRQGRAFQVGSVTVDFVY